MSGNFSDADTIKLNWFGVGNCWVAPWHRIYPSSRQGLDTACGTAGAGSVPKKQVECSHPF